MNDFSVDIHGRANRSACGNFVWTLLIIYGVKGLDETLILFTRKLHRSVFNMQLLIFMNMQVWYFTYDFLYKRSRRVLYVPKYHSLLVRDFAFLFSRLILQHLPSYLLLSTLLCIINFQSWKLLAVYDSVWSSSSSDPISIGISDSFTSCSLCMLMASSISRVYTIHPTFVNFSLYCWISFLIFLYYMILIALFPS